MFFCYDLLGDNMKIIYRKNTLYVYLDEDFDKNSFKRLENKIDNIMGIYNISNLVLNSKCDEKTMKEFEVKYNSHHKSPIIIR